MSASHDPQGPPHALPYGTELAGVVAALATLTSDPNFQREITAQATTRSDLASLRVLRVMSYSGLRRPAELARETGLSRSQISKALARLEADGLIARERDEDDGRGVRINITPDGLDAVRAIYDIGDRFFAEVVKDWLPQEVTLLTTLLGRFVRDARDAVERLGHRPGADKTPSV